MTELARKQETSKVDNEVKSEFEKTGNQSSFHTEDKYSMLGTLSFCFDKYVSRVLGTRDKTAG